MLFSRCPLLLRFERKFDRPQCPDLVRINPPFCGLSSLQSNQIQINADLSRSLSLLHTAELFIFLFVCSILLFFFLVIENRKEREREINHMIMSRADQIRS